MKSCLICKNSINHKKYQTICEGCVNLLRHADFCCSHCAVSLPLEQYERHENIHEKRLCGQCQLKPPAFSSVAYVTVYQEPINHWIMSLKFGQNIVISRLFAELMSEKLAHIDADYELMPVPLHKARLRKRGYNQAYEIAKEMAKSCKRSLNTSLLRQKNTEMQAELKLKQRAKNVSKAFSVNADVQGKKIVLIDDVMTSGNTLKECAKTLKKAKVADVKIIVFARKSLN